MEDRINAADYAPFRPYIADPDGKKASQQARGMLLQGTDPKSGKMDNFGPFILFHLL
jgi:hypothetical protein